MREIQTLILRLMVDPDESQPLRGALRAVADGKEHSFTDERSLVALLRWMSRRPRTAPEGQDDCAHVPRG